ncbi:MULTISPECIES: hypothetical protein [unclassified Mycobacterium]|uniref:hypothetical protein n=1 Tax=unclassified Mycobacterium TaxID=2642494 RepID=UPI00114D58D8|nr:MULTISPECIES: hypothetical protein [unclassified Mycobacterium]
MAAVAAGVMSVYLSACTAQADSPKFPDISGYVPVNAQEYEIDTSTPGMPAGQVFFLTPDGIPCTFLSGAVGCTGGNLPGIQEKDKNPYTYIDTAVGVQRAGSTPYENGTVRDHPIKELPPYHSITVGGATCGVDDKGTTACKDSEGRGFILSSTWSGWLPKV